MIKLSKLNTMTKKTVLHFRILHVTSLPWLITFLGTKLSFFLVGSLWLLAGSWFRRKPSGRATNSPVALVVAEQPPRMKWMATEQFRVWPNWHSILAQLIGLNSSDVTRLVAAERVQNNIWLLKLRSLLTANLLILSFTN